MDWYAAAKDFTGPIATIIASAAALIVTARLARSQARAAASQADGAATQRQIAQTQRDITLDKLKLDLFDKRYAVYAAARQLIERVAREMHDGPYDEKVRELRTVLQEASFFFADPQLEVFNRIEATVRRYLVAERQRDSSDNSDASRLDATNRMKEALNVLVQIYDEFPSLMERELGFSQLTGRK